MAFAWRGTSRAGIHLQRDAGTGEDFLCPRDELMQSCRVQTGLVKNLHVECRRLRRSGICIAGQRQEKEQKEIASV
jgi:hypothetical protein